MKTWPKPADFDGEKFAMRYGLSAIDGDFGVTFADGVEMVYVKDRFLRRITDNPPIFEAPDPPKPLLTDRINALASRADPELVQVLLELARGR